MNRNNKIVTAWILFFYLYTNNTYAQNNQPDSASFYNQVKTYVNPVLPGDHPDPTLLKVGDDYYHCGSSFHFTPYLPIYHSKDLVHWEIISRVLAPPKADWVTDKPSVGVWQGAITYFHGWYWIYFSANGQWFCKASSPYGPWSDAVQVKTNPLTGNLGYDNSIFLDDDGRAYMLIKNLQKVNRIQALDKDGQLTDTVINLDWINANLQYSWAEGPVMCKRNGYYLYFPAGDVSGGQYVLRTKQLTSDSSKWERLGDFFKPVTDENVGFRRPNHISAPFQIADSTWWTTGQSYEKYDNDDWSGMGRQTSLFQVIWEGDRPWGVAPTSHPFLKPNLPRSGLLWRSVQSDYFGKDALDLCWHFLSKKDWAHYSLTARKGWVRLSPDSGKTSLMQKETDHYYAVVTKAELNATDTSTKAGLYLSNGNQSVTVQLFTGFDSGKKIIFKTDGFVQSIPNKFGNTVWLKIERSEHLLTAYCSGDGKSWTQIGIPVSAVNLDKTQPNWNSWVGTSLGLFAQGKPADFDLFICKDGFSPMPAVGYYDYYGVEKVKQRDALTVTNTSNYGGWFMISGVECGKDKNTASAIALTAASTKSGNVEIWLDDLTNGVLVATVSIAVTGKNNWKIFKQSLKNISGHHDVFVKFPAGANHETFIKSIRLIPTK